VFVPTLALREGTIKPDVNLRPVSSCGPDVRAHGPAAKPSSPEGLMLAAAKCSLRRNARCGEEAREYFKQLRHG
jgi:hypothetical protein